MKFPILLLLILVAAACAPSIEPTPGPDTAVTSPPVDSMPTGEPATSPFAPQPGDSGFTRGPAYINEASLIIRESFPPQIALILKGDLPTPCHQLRAVVPAPNADNEILVEVYSVAAPDQACVQVLEPFDVTIELGTFPGGHYTVRVNGEPAGEFDS